MQEQTRKTVKKIIDINKQAIKNSAPKVTLKENPDFLTIKLDRDKAEIHQILKKLRSQHNELLPFVKEIKKYIQDITETTYVCAAYLLLCHTFQNWNSLFLLAEYGKNSAIQTLIRMIEESLKLIELFVVESKNKRDNIDKWYSGEIIIHGTGRKMTNKFFDDLLNTNSDIEELETHIYQMESQTPHNSYASVLECISPFTEDYDFEGYTGFHRTNESAIKYAEGKMKTTIITLKTVYSLLLKDQHGFEKVNKILLKYNPKYKVSDKRLEVDS